MRSYATSRPSDSRTIRPGRACGRRVELEETEIGADASPERVLTIHEALDRLSEEDARSADVVKLRYFAGLGEAEVAELLGLSHRTVQRDWAYARAWLYEAPADS